MPEQTLKEAARELHEVTIALAELLEREYPKREEVERKFATKQESRSRLRQGLLILAIALPVSIIFSFFATFATLSTCFLRDNGVPPSVCQVMPGFSKAAENNKSLLKQFQKLIKITETNEARIKELEEKVNES